MASGGYLTLGNGEVMGVYYGSGTTSPDNVTVTAIAGSNACVWSNSGGDTWSNNANWNTGACPTAPEPPLSLELP